MEGGNQVKLDPKTVENLNRLKQWLYAGGAHYESVQLTNFSNTYRGIISTKPIKKDQSVVFIPKTHLITLQMAKEDPICSLLTQQQIQIISPKHTFLAIFLLQERAKGKQSSWKLYLDLLPEDFSSFPINYTNQQLVELIGSPFLMQIHEKVYDLKRDYDKIYQFSPLFRNYSFKDFCWARTVVGSRIFGLFIDGVKTDILAPFADMLNHKLPKQTAWNYVDDKNGFEIYSLEDIPAGVQVFDSYGKKCNSRYLLNYGFVTPDNPENQVCLRSDLEGELKEKKHEMIKKVDGIVKILKISCTLNDIGFYQSMGFLRFKAISDINYLAVLEKISRIKISNEAYIASKTPPINMELEVKIWIVLKAICFNALKEYPTTLQQDKQLLKNKVLSENMRNILILRSGEKEVLKTLISYSDEVVSILRQGFGKAMDYLSKNQDQPWSKYLSRILSIMPGEKSKILNQNLLVEPEECENQDNEQELVNN